MPRYGFTAGCEGKIHIGTCRADDKEVVIGDNVWIGAQAVILKGVHNVSDLNRMRFIEEGIRLIKERPIFGWGLANYAYVSGVGAYSHNNFVEVWVSTGIFGFLIYYSIYAISVWTVIRRFLYRKEVSMIVMLIVVLINVVFGYGMVQYETKNTWLLFAVMMAIVDERKIDEYEGREST